MSISGLLSHSPFPPNLRNELAYPLTPWQMSPEVKLRMPNDNQHVQECTLLPTDPEARFASLYFNHSKPKGCGISKITRIYNATLERAFEAEILNTEREGSKFLPSWREEKDSVNKESVIERWKSMTDEFYPFQVPSSTTVFQHARILPLFHGTTKLKSKSICESGFTYFGKHEQDQESTDDGYYGSGCYFTDDANYGSKYSDGTLVLSIVCTRLPYPVSSDTLNPKRCSDMEKLRGRGAYRNYNAHFIPVGNVNPENPNSLEYYPCVKDEPPSCCEVVVFQRGNANPLCLIEMAVDTPAFQIPQRYNFFNGYMACQNARMSQIVDWINEDPSRLNETGTKGEMFIHAAVLGGQLEMVKWLYNQNAALIKARLKDGTTLLHIASAKGHLEIAQWIHEKDAMQITLQNKEKKNPLFYAALYQRIPVLKLFFDNIKKDPSFIFPLMEKPISDTIKYLLSEGICPNTANSFKQTFMHICAQSGHENNILELLKYKADLKAKDRSGRTPLFLAVLQGHRSVVNCLLNKGANMDPNFENETLLHIAAFYGYTPILQDLLRYYDGLKSINEKDSDGKTPLHRACWGFPKTDVVDLLISYKADINAINNYGYTPLHWSCKHGHRNSTAKLINAGAKVDVTNVNGHTPIDLAIEHEQDEIMHLFLSTKKDNRHKNIKLNVKKEEKLADEKQLLLQAQTEGHIEEQIVGMIKLSNIFSDMKCVDEARALLTGSLVLISKLPNYKNYYVKLLQKALTKRLNNLLQIF
jgi:ankyrin repeat protein